MRIYAQSGVVPFIRDEGRLKYMLITSMRARRWIIPKGLIEPHMTPQESAANEAYEEAGVHGIVHPTLIGTWRRKKWGGMCLIKVYLMEVEHQLDHWPENQWRERRWFNPREAAQIVEFPDLSSILSLATELLDT